MASYGIIPDLRQRLGMRLTIQGEENQPCLQALSPCLALSTQEGQLEICLEQIRRPWTHCLETQAEALASQDSQF